MKKLALFCAAAVALSSLSVGCSSDGSSSSWCRSGSLFPTARNRQHTEQVYLNSAASHCDPCAEVSACNPCEPVCNPCDMTCSGEVISGGITTPHPM